MEIKLLNASIESVELDESVLFDVITLLECSELIPNGYPSIRRLADHLQPGGLLIMTKTPDWMSYLFPGRGQHSRQLRPFLESMSFQSVVITPWRWRYELVTAWKSECSFSKV
jgi:2-polyprenyl-3-methyl-5-hydroxy-6-metoxy-1,4-benzoquinol methylase